MENERKINSLVTDQEENINLRQEIEKYLPYWRFFAVSCFLCLCIGFIYIRYTNPVYSATAMVLIKDNKNAGISTELAAFEDLGIIGGGSANNPENEVEIIKSRNIIGFVVDSLQLQYSYFRQGRVKNTELYKETPIKLKIIKNETFFELDTLVSISVLNDSSFDLLNADNEKFGTYNFDTEIKNEWGSFEIKKTEFFQEHDFEEFKDILISIASRNSKIDGILKKLEVAPIDQNSSVLTLKLDNTVKEKAEDILNELINQYNIDAIDDQNQVSNKTKIFIDERLLKIGQDLSEIQDAATEYKDKNKITGLSVEGELALRSVVENNENLIAITTELSLAKWIQKRLQNSETDFLPENLGFKDIKISETISYYNKLVSLRNKLALNAGEKNPNLKQANMDIASYKQSLQVSFENLIFALSNQLNVLEREASKLNKKVNTIPTIERGFIDIARQQEIVSELYSYLLKKKEETAISLAVTVPKAKIIDVAYAPEKPVSPKKKLIMFGALLLGLIIPFSLIYVKNLLDTKIHTRKEIIDVLSIPFLGDVPHSEDDQKIVIKENSRTSVAEAFRLIRTNLNFLLASNQNQGGKVIFVTSTISGEGKSFISMNLAATLSLTNRKVILIGLDLRAPKITSYLGLPERKGITNFITKDDVKLDELKFQVDQVENLDIISSGVIPPNPAELLLHKRVTELFDELKNNYDYIVVDTAPVNLVTDTLLISKYSDITLYVTRSNYLDKRMLNIPDNLYKEKRLPNMAIVLNDTDMKRGYGYGYGYGYGKGYVEAEKKPFWKRLMGI